MLSRLSFRRKFAVLASFLTLLSIFAPLGGDIALAGSLPKLGIAEGGNPNTVLLGLPDTQKVTCQVTTTAGQAAIGLSGCVNFVTGASVPSPFSPASVGKNIIVNYAGASLTTAPVTVTMATQGGGYTTMPTITIADTTGVGALAQPIMELEAATVVYGGTGCFNGGTGQVPFDLIGGTGTHGIVSGHVTNGVLDSGSLAIVLAGAYQDFTTVNNPLIPTNIFINDYVCIQKPVISATFRLSGVLMRSTGQNYSSAVTASISTGSATLNAPTLGAPVAQPLATTIAAYVDSAHVTLAVAPSQTLSGASEYVVLGGTDNAAAMQAAINAAAASTTPASAYIPAVPPGFCYGVRSAFADPDTTPITIFGAGESASELCALTSMAALETKGSGVMAAAGSRHYGYTLNGNKVALAGVSGACGGRSEWDHVDAKNPAPYALGWVIGDGVSTCPGGSYHAIHAINDASIYSGNSDLPFDGAKISAGNTLLVDFEGSEQGVHSVWVANGVGTRIVNPHVYGSDSPAYCYEIDYPSTILTDSLCNGANVGSVHVTASDVTVKGGGVGPQCCAPQAGVIVESGLNDIRVSNYDAHLVTIPKNRVQWVGAIGVGNSSVNNLGAWPQFAPGTKTVLCQGSPQITTTSTVEIIAADCPIPGGLMGLTGGVEVKAYFGFTASTHSKTMFIRFGGYTSPSNVGSLTTAASTNQSATFDDYIGNVKSQSSQTSSPAYTLGLGVVGAGSAFTSTGYNTANMQHILLNMLMSGGDVGTLYTYEISVTPPAM